MWAFYELARHPAAVRRLRNEILDTVGASRAPTYEDLKAMRFLRAVIDETLRLYPGVPYNIRCALRDTTLPRGGGPDGLGPVGMPKGTGVTYSTLSMQLRADLLYATTPTSATATTTLATGVGSGGDDGYDAKRKKTEKEKLGGDSEKAAAGAAAAVAAGGMAMPGVLEWAPERWVDAGWTPPAWHYVPFNGGPRICIGQQFALTELSYTVVRVLQRYARLELVPPPGVASTAAAGGAGGAPGAGDGDGASFPHYMPLRSRIILAPALDLNLRFYREG
jgi:hypothetical protein